MRRILHLITQLESGGSETLLFSYLQEVQIISSDIHQVICLHAKHDVITKFEKSKIKVTTLNIKNRTDIFLNRTKLKLSNFICKFDPDVIQTNLIDATILLARTIPLLSKQPFVIHMLHESARFTFGRLLYRYFLTKFKNSHYIAVSESVKKTWCKFLNIPESRIVVLHNFINCHFDKDKKRDIQKPSKLLYVGRLAHTKGVDILLKAFALSCRFNNSLTLDIVGEGLQRKHLENFVTKHTLKNIFFHGRKDPLSFYNAADILVLPSRNEGFGITILEAWAHDLIVIASNTDGIPEIIENEINGFLFQAGNYKELSQLIGKITNQENYKYLRIRQHSRISLSGFSSPADYVRKINDIYNRLEENHRY